MVSFVKLARVFQQSAGLLKQSTKTVQNFRHLSLTGVYNAERRFTDKHEWVSFEGNVGIVGISTYAQEALGDVVFAQLPDPGTVLKQHDECGALESVKAASEVYSPVSGEVTDKNNAVEDSPSLINTSCYDEGWLFKIKLTNTAELDKLMTEDQYKEFLKSAEH
ncbi:hypothetical protein DOY81_000714 [Sarcophaga bullata]|nr:hypothetical protein DOY81_000714 [Sarcophaga bullata]